MLSAFRSDSCVCVSVWKKLFVESQDGFPEMMFPVQTDISDLNNSSPFTEQNFPTSTAATKQLTSGSPNMMASSVAVQGSGTFSVLWPLSVGIRLSLAVGLAKVLVTRLPVQQWKQGIIATSFNTHPSYRHTELVSSISYHLKPIIFLSMK